MAKIPYFDFAVLLTSPQLNVLVDAINGLQDSMDAGWQAGHVTSVGSGLSLAAGVLSSTVTQNWSASAVDTVGNGLTITSKKLDAEWHAGEVASVSTGLSLTKTALTADWQGGQVTSLGAGMLLTKGVLTSPDPVITAAGLAFVNGLQVSSAPYGYTLAPFF